MFDCRTSVSRKSVLPVLEGLNGLQFHPVRHEGEDASKNAFDTGAVPNQQAIPAMDCDLEDPCVQSSALPGTDCVHPRTTNNIPEAFLISKGILREDFQVSRTPFGRSDGSKIGGGVVALGADGKVGGIPVAELHTPVACDRACTALEMAGTLPTAATEGEAKAALAAASVLPHPCRPRRDRRRHRRPGRDRTQGRGDAGRRPGFRCVVAGHDPFPGGHLSGHHLRRDGRPQHGAWRVHHRRGPYRLCRPAFRARGHAVAPGRADLGLCRHVRRGHGDGAAGDPAPLQSSAGDAAGDPRQLHCSAAGSEERSGRRRCPAGWTGR